MMFYLALWVWNLVLLKLSPPFCYFSKQTLHFNSFLHAVTFSSTIIPVPFLHYFFLENRLNFFFSRWYILWHRSSWLHFLAIPSAPLFHELGPSRISLPRQVYVFWIDFDEFPTLTSLVIVYILRRGATESTQHTTLSGLSSSTHCRPMLPAIWSGILF